MEGKKRYIAIILFLLICLMLFTFATTGDEELEAGKGNGSDIQEVTNKGDSDKDKETDKDSESDKESNNQNSSSTGSSNNGSSNAGDDEDLDGTGNTDNSAWDKALAAVEELEKVLTDDQLNIARELVEEITNSDQYKELIERVEDAEDAIDATALVEALEKMVEEATKREDIEDASDFRDDEVLDAINEIDGEYLEEVKEELLDRIEELNKILDDATAPTVEGIEDGDKTKEDVELTITDDNEVTITVTKDGQTYEYVEKFTEEGTYEVTVVDSAFNETKLTFTIDKTAIAVQSANMYSNGKKYTVDKDVYFYATNGQTITAYVRLKEQSATLPIITLTIDGKEYVLENVKESFHNESDKENGIYKYEGTFTIPSDMKVENAVVTYTVTNITDEAGNETTVTKVTNKNIIVVDTVKPKYDKLALVGGKGYWYDKEYKQYAKDDTIVYVNVRMREELATTPVVRLNDTITLTKATKKETNGIWIYSYSYRLKANDGIADGVLQVKVTNVEDKAGNSIELTNEHATLPSQKEIIVDRKAITLEGIDASEYTYDGVGVTPSTKDTDVQSVKLEKDGEVVEGYELGTAIINAGSYKLTVTDLAGNKTVVEFIINKKQLEFELNVDETYEYAGNEIKATINVTNAESTDVYEIDERYYIMNDKGQFEGPLKVDYAKELGTYKVKVVIVSKNANYADSETKSLTFKVVDTTPAEITLPFPMGKETYEYRIESGTEVTLEDVTATVTDIHDGTSTLKPYRAELYIGKASENDYNYDLSKGLDTRQIGRYNLYYTYTDQAGNVSNLTLLLFMKDTTPATITIPGTAGLNKNEYIVEAGTKVTVEDILATVTDNVDPESKLAPFKADLLIGGKEENKYNYDFSNGFETNYHGRYNLYYTYTDKAGHTTDAGMMIVMKDTVAPTLEITENGNMVYVRGKDVTRLKYKVIKDGKTVHTVDSETCGCGNYFSITWLAKTYGDGEYTIEVVDAGGNKASAKAIVDTTAPTYKFYKEGSSLDKDEIQPTIINGKLYFNQNVRVVFKEETTYFTQYIHNDFVNNENKTTIKSWQREALTNGEHTMKVTDAKGNVTEVTFFIDKVAPELTVKEESVGTDSIYSQISLKLYDNNKVDYVLINGNKFDVGNAQWSDANYGNIKEYLVEGENTAVLYDEVGNTTEMKFVMDWTIPEVTEFTQKYEAKEDGRIKVTLTFSEAMQPIGQGWYAVDGKENTYSKVYYSTKEHTIKFKDLAGNEGTYTFTVDKTPNRVTQTFYRGDKNIDKTYYVKNGDKIQFNIGFSEKLGEAANITIGGKKVELTYEKYYEATKSHMYYGYLEVAEDETELVEGELEISISNITDEVGNPGFYYQTNGKKVIESYKNVLTTNGKKVIYDNTPNRVTQTFYRGSNVDGLKYYLVDGDQIQFNIGFREKLSEDAVITIGGKKVELKYDKYYEATNSHMYYGYLKADTNEKDLIPGELEVQISNVTDFVGNKGFYYQTNGKTVYETYKFTNTTNANVAIYKSSIFEVSTEEELVNAFPTAKEIKFLNNIVLTSTLDLEQNRELIINLNNNKLEFKTDNDGEGLIKSSGSLTIKNGTLENNDINKNIIIDKENGTLTLEGVTVNDKASYSGTTIFNRKGQMTINNTNINIVSENTGCMDGTVEACGNTAIENYGDLVITNSTITSNASKRYGITTHGGNVTVDNVTLNVHRRGGIAIQGGDVTVSNTNISTYWYAFYVANYEGDTNVTINSGTYTASGYSIIYNGNAVKTNKGLVTVNDGTFQTLSNKRNLLTLDGSAAEGQEFDIVINGGTWKATKNNAADYVADGYEIDSKGKVNVSAPVEDTVHEGLAGGGAIVEEIPEDSEEFIAVRGDALDKLFNIKTMISFNIAEPSKIKEVRFTNSTIGEGYGTTQVVTADKLYGFKTDNEGEEYYTQINFTFNEVIYFDTENIIKGDNAVIVLEDKAGNTYELELLQDIPIYR